MDTIDTYDMEQESLDIRYSPSTALHHAQKAIARQHQFGGDMTTKEQVEAEMKYTRENCTPCKIKEK